MTSGSAPLPLLWFGPPPELRLDERWVAHHPANRSQGKRAVGGGLHFTNHRVLFTPNVIDARLGGNIRVFTFNDALRGEGSINVEKGRYSAYGQKLDIERGVLTFTGPISNPRIDIGIRGKPSLRKEERRQATVSAAERLVIARAGYADRSPRRERPRAGSRSRS